ncbi:MAG: hypothetical protein EB114_07250 [Betaproteobacteria bacterium]|nr:hypothetical protein [Betaproteobacteria bacterium]
MGRSHGFCQFHGEIRRRDGRCHEVVVAGGWKVIMPPLALFFYYFASEKLGFWLCAFVIVLTLAKSMGATFRSAILLGLIAPGVIHLIFYKLLRVPLPAGLLPFPWV